MHLCETFLCYIVISLANIYKNCDNLSIYKYSIYKRASSAETIKSWLVFHIIMKMY